MQQVITRRDVTRHPATIAQRQDMTRDEIRLWQRPANVPSHPASESQIKLADSQFLSASLYVSKRGAY